MEISEKEEDIKREINEEKRRNKNQWNNTLRLQRKHTKGFV